MTINITTRINQYAQNKQSFEEIMFFFEQLDSDDKRSFYCQLFEMIQQSKCLVSDIDDAIIRANIKPTLNCCVIARKGVYYSNIKRLENLKDVYPTMNFLLNLFKIGYDRRKLESSSVNKWWYNSL